MQRTVRLIVVALALATTTGCSLSKFAVDSIASGMDGATANLRAQFDYEVAGHGAASSIMQFEAFHAISPDNEALTMALAQTYLAYAYGWVMDEYERDTFEQRYDEADRHKQRAHLMYTRARDLLLRAMRERHEGIDEVLYAKEELLAAYLKEHYDDPEDDIGLVFWMAMAWGAMIDSSSVLDDLIDLPNVKAMAKHARALDESYEDGGPMALLGGLEAAYPEQLGGDLAKGREYFETALKLADRRNHIQLVNYASSYAVNAQDRELYVALLMEVIEAEDQGSKYRLSNKVARRRAERRLQHVDDYFSADL